MVARNRDILNSIDMTSHRAFTMLCLASYEKGHRFLQEAKKQGCRVLLLTSQSLQGKWPADVYDDIFYMPDNEFEWNLQHMLQGVNHLSRVERIERIVPLDDFDLEKAALLREHLRLPGLGETATRYFRDKLAMRKRATESGIRVPAFTGTAHYQDVTDFLEKVPAPWVLKPRLMAGAMGIRKCHTKEEVWGNIHSLGDQQSYFVLEQFVPGDIFHVDSIWFGGEMLFAISSAYGTPPLEVTTGGGIFTTETLEAGSEVDAALREMNKAVLSACGLRDGVSHTEFIKAHADGALYFLETSARVGGANIADLIEAASGLNLWTEWAKVEVAAARGGSYHVEEHARQQAGLLVSLARQEWPDTSSFNEPELVWRMKKKHHVGFIVKSPQRQRVTELLKLYTDRVRNEHHASAPPRDKPGE
jgi:ATP-grasp domain